MIRSFSAYVPCYHNAATVRRAVESLLAQSLPPAEVLVIDDGSPVPAAAAVAGLPVRVIRHSTNLGRGATRARAMAEVRHEFVLCCDATMALDPAFAEKTLPWFGGSAVAAVFGRVVATAEETVADRWRSRHLFKVAQQPATPRHRAELTTNGTIFRSAAVRAVGGFNPTLRHSEDAELGRRLLAEGFDVISDPRPEVIPTAHNSLRQVLERYWRWYAGADEATTWRGYGKNIGYAVKAMARADLAAGDPAAALVSLACPHFQFWKSRLRRSRRIPSPS